MTNLEALPDHITLIADGDEQIVRFPMGTFEGSEVTLRKDGDKIIIEPVKPSKSE